MLYKTFQAHRKTFLAELESAAETPVLPAFVIAEVEAFLRCGILAHGLILASLVASMSGSRRYVNRRGCLLAPGAPASGGGSAIAS